MVGSETMVADLPYNWERVQKYPQLLGDFVWSAWITWGKPVLATGLTIPTTGCPCLPDEGMIDITGKPLASMYFMQIVWALRKRTVHWSTSSESRKGSANHRRMAVYKCHRQLELAGL